jgi:hypothetical protein
VLFEKRILLGFLSFVILNLFVGRAKLGWVVIWLFQDSSLAAISGIFIDFVG